MRTVFHGDEAAFLVDLQVKCYAWVKGIRSDNTVSEVSVIFGGVERIASVACLVVGLGVGVEDSARPFLCNFSRRRWSGIVQQETA